ncbi:alpha-D-ribose 1-methylphosphonate 5-triphosphate diphosphatase [Ciceribacter sp. L1K22]|uniref:alpha-D-ribose 1-methylphosphonate 5-triphosphate diphosphatase n=1 Tax=Ciceribacter sp. L1K22 TaxID=2820275 RepID=UPI001ABEE36B|nr:alpha-D-ribose 1-methylphosphonate 5-triphosphate diphosphatase [Ciceribacter sp. L1K22]MBO3760101.1 alpha-D-ribose 1-methylphosphonate 5-triphosphate diphosphatase [Ciceribacter sp. L1K22]
MNWIIRNGAVLGSERLDRADLFINEGRVSGRASDGREIDAEGLLVLPGIVDIHGDGFERQIMPRPGVRFDVGLALRDTDRQLVANGITTAFHGVTVSWEPGLRSLKAAEDFVTALLAARPHLACDTRLHLRWETFALDALPHVIDWLALDPKPVVALNDHTTGSVLKGTIARKIGQMAERSGLSREDYMALLDSVWARRDEVAGAIERLAMAARDNGNVLLAHDEASPDERRHFRALGVVSSEFPLTLETAAEARSAGEHVILGAPNVVRGGSHNGALDATTAIRDGLCTVLASDYHYPSPLHAAFRLASPGDEGFAKAWALVSANAAAAAGLSDRGRLEEGSRADIVLVDAKDVRYPKVVATFVGGRLVYSAATLLASESVAASAAA